MTFLRNVNVSFRVASSFTRKQGAKREPLLRQHHDSFSLESGLHLYRTWKAAKVGERFRDTLPSPPHSTPAIERRRSTRLVRRCLSIQVIWLPSRSARVFCPVRISNRHNQHCR